MAFDKMQRKRNKMRVRDCIRIGEGIFFPQSCSCKADLVASNFFFYLSAINYLIYKQNWQRNFRKVE